MTHDGIEQPPAWPDADAHHIAGGCSGCQHAPFAEFVFSRAVLATANP